MEYRANAKYNFDDQNESRADQTERVLAIGTDRNGECDADTRGVFTDVSDLLANLRHFCDRAGIDYGEVDGHAQHAYEGDLAESGPAVKRDTERFPDPVPATKED
jgi:hypothetical protein